METLTLLSAPLIVTLMGAVCVYASEKRKVFGVIALSFSIIMASLTSTVHFFTLTAGRQTGFTVLEWPSALYAIELLAWDVFLGLCLLSAAYVFPGSGIRAKVRWCLLISGSLCLLGAIGPILGDMLLQRVGILGYGIGLPISSLVLAWFFRREEGRGYAKEPE